MFGVGDEGRQQMDGESRPSQPKMLYTPQSKCNMTRRGNTHILLSFPLQMNISHQVRTWIADKWILLMSSTRHFTYERAFMKTLEFDLNLPL